MACRSSFSDSSIGSLIGNLVDGRTLVPSCLRPPRSPSYLGQGAYRAKGPHWWVIPVQPFSGADSKREDLAGFLLYQNCSSGNK